MPRLPRLHVPGGYYHVTSRGNHRESLFGSPEDRDALDDIVASVIQHYGARLHAYCWMTNHIHLVLDVGEVTSGKIMQRILMRYSRYRHVAMNTSGHLFERRHGAKLVDNTAYLQELLRYIHLNPVSAGMVFDPAQYRWSSHRAYLGTETIPWLTTDVGLSTFGQDIETARRAYIEFMKQPTDELESKLSSPTLSMDPRILGSDDFASRLPVPVIRPRCRLTLDEVAERVCRKHSISVDEVRSSSRARRLSHPRAELTALVRHARIATLTELAEYLDRQPSALAQLLEKHPQEIDHSLLKQ